MSSNQVAGWSYNEDEWQAAIEENINYSADCGHELPIQEILNTPQGTSCPECFFDMGGELEDEE